MYQPSIWEPRPNELGEKLFSSLPYMHYNPVGPQPVPLLDNVIRTNSQFRYYSAAAKSFIDRYNRLRLYQIIRGPTSAEIVTLMQGQATETTAGKSFPRDRFFSSPGKRALLFTENFDGHFVQCERCGTLFNDGMQAISLSSLPRRMAQGPFASMSYVFCSANEGDSCQSNATGPWLSRLNRITAKYRQVTINTLEILGSLHPRALIQCVYGREVASKVKGLEQIELANKSLRVIWIRHFACRPNETPPDMPADDLDEDSAVSAFHYTPMAPEEVKEFYDEDKTTASVAICLKIRFGDIALWGDAALDLILFREGHITTKQLKYLYGIYPVGLDHIVSWKWDEEVTWVNAYVGCRRHVTAAHYMLLKRAIQRVGSAMEKFVLIPSHERRILCNQNEKLFELVGLRFHELHSALGADPKAMDRRANEVVPLKKKKPARTAMPWRAVPGQCKL